MSSPCTTLYEYVNFDTKRVTCFSMDPLALYNFDRSCPGVSENLNCWGNYFCNVTIIKIATLLLLFMKKQNWLKLQNIRQQTQTLFRGGRESYMYFATNRKLSIRFSQNKLFVHKITHYNSLSIV